MKQFEVLSKLMTASGVRSTATSAASPYTGLSPAGLAFVRCEIVGRLGRAFSGASSATHKHGRSSGKDEQHWRDLEAELRQLTTLTLLMTSQDNKK